MATYDVTKAPYNAVSDYNPGAAGNTNNTPKIGQAIADCIAAGGGTVYIPGGGTGYLLNSTGSQTNSIFPTIGIAGVRIVGDAIGKGGSVLVKNVDKHTFMIGAGPSAGGGWAGGASPKGVEIGGLTIRPAKGFYSTTVEFECYNIDMLDVHNFNITDFGWVYGPAGQTFAVYPAGSGSLTGLYYAKVPRPGVTTDPRGAGWQSADMGRLNLGFRFRGNVNYNITVRLGIIDGVVGGIEFGEYDNHTETPQGIAITDVGVWRYHQFGVVWYSGDGSVGCSRCHVSQGAGPAYQYIPPSQPKAGGGVDYGLYLNECGVDWIGDHGVWVRDVTGGGQTVNVGLNKCYIAGAGAADAAAAGYPAWQPGKKGVLFQNGIVGKADLTGCTIILNSNDGCEFSADVGPGRIWDNEFRGNGMDGNPASGLYVNNNSLNLNVQRNVFNGTYLGTTQAYGLYVNNTNISLDIYCNNQAVNNVTAETNLGQPGVPVPGVSGLNIP